MQPALEIRGLYKSFRVRPAGPMTLFRHMRNANAERGSVREVLKDVSLSVDPGEWLGVIGRNGSGKTTLMRMAAGIFTPTRGSVVTRGRVAAILQLGLGLIGRLSVRDNIFLYGAVMGLTRAEIRARLAAILEFSELGDSSDREVRRLSSGQVQRLSLAVAIQVDADVLLLDEVLAVGDQHFKERCFDHFENRMPPSRAVLFASHSMSEVRRFCARTVWLVNGEVAALGDTEDVVARYEADG
jgi:ABC-type polysaccharide/polyol phosphate transport system ATPase subunit